MLNVNDHSRASAGLSYVYPVVSRRAGGVSVGTLATMIIDVQHGRNILTDSRTRNASHKVTSGAMI